MNKEDQGKLPRRVVFENSTHTELNSVADVKSSDSFSLALTEDGSNVYSWGRGIMGHLGNGSENTHVTPQKINFNFTDEQKKIKKVKGKGGSTQSEVEDLLFFKNFLNNASKTKGSSKLAKAQSFIEEKCILELQNLEDKDKKKFAGEYTVTDKQEIDILLTQMDRVRVTRIACSNKHSLVCTNTGAIFSWGQNDFS